jgi:hypothetical protein
MTTCGSRIAETLRLRGRTWIFRNGKSRLARMGCQKIGNIMCVLLIPRGCVDDIIRHAQRLFDGLKLPPKI